jgi:hypothetical protein
MTELSILYLFLGVAFTVAPFMTNNFFLGVSQSYSRAHAASLFMVIGGMVFDLCPSSRRQVSLW